MSFVTLTPHVFLDDVSASAVSSWYPMDYRAGESTLRSISGNKHTSDSVLLELLTSAAGVQVIATATTWGTGSTTLSTVFQGPFNAVRVRKSGANGDANVVGIV